MEGQITAAEQEARRGAKICFCLGFLTAGIGGWLCGRGLALALITAIIGGIGFGGYIYLRDRPRP